MADTKTVIEQAYSAFNKRDIDGALALMTQDVSWPRLRRAAGFVGKEEVRAYGLGQWRGVRSPCRTACISDENGGKTRVRVHQLVKSSRRRSFGQRDPACLYSETTVLLKPWTSVMKPTLAVVRLQRSPH